MKDYSSLPMIMDQEEISRTVEEILLSQNDPQVSNMDTAEALSEMLMRQTSLYRQFDKNIIQKMEQWLTKVWDKNSAPFVDICATLIASTEMVEGKRLLEEAERSTNEKVRKIAKEALVEIQN